MVVFIYRGSNFCCSLAVGVMILCVEACVVVRACVCAC